MTSNSPDGIKGVHHHACPTIKFLKIVKPDKDDNKTIGQFLLNTQQNTCKSNLRTC